MFNWLFSWLNSQCRLGWINKDSLSQELVLWLSPLWGEMANEKHKSKELMRFGTDYEGTSENRALAVAFRIHIAVKSTGFWDRPSLVWTLFVTLSCVTLDKLLNLSNHSFLVCKAEIIMELWEWKGKAKCKALTTWPTLDKYSLNRNLYSLLFLLCMQLADSHVWAEW